MASAALAWFGPRARGGVVVAPGPAEPCAPLEWIQGGHPAPTDGSIEGGRRALAVAEGLAADERLVVLLSGGASALLAAPADGVSLDDQRETTSRLMREGADIHALNAVRQHLSDVKGGWLAARAAGASLTFAVSDVVGDDPSDIGSGPTVADPSTFADAIAVIERFGGVSRYPDAVVRHLEAGRRGSAAETPKPGDPRLARAAWHLVGGRRDAMAGATAEAAARGYATLCLDEPVVGEARAAGARLLGEAEARAARLARPACVVSERRDDGPRDRRRARRTQPGVRPRRRSTRWRPGRRRRSPAPAPTAWTARPMRPGRWPTPAASPGRARPGSTPLSFCQPTTPTRFFDALGDLIQTGPTGTNVGDLQVVLLA